MATYPYVGLRPFQPDEADIFFGRDDELIKILQKLDRHHFIAVLGDSGCGKSSLVHVGLVNKLRLGMFYGAFWLIAKLHPGEDTPFKNLAKSLRRIGLFSQLSQDDLLSQLKLEKDSLAHLLEKVSLPEDTNLLIVVDQFEELFRYPRQRDEVEIFLNWLIASAEHERVFIVITMRSEYLAKCAQYYELILEINKGLYLVPPLSQEQLREIITSPIGIFGGMVEKQLVETIIQDVTKNKQDQLPLIQHTLMSLCPSSIQELKGYTLLLADYNKIGGIAGSIDNTANSILKGLNKSQQKIAEIVFRNLTTKDKKLDSLIRNQIKLGEIIKLAGMPHRSVKEVIDKFRSRRCKFIMPLLLKGQEDSLQTDTGIIDIGHESLIREWERLRMWAEQEAKLVNFYHKLVDAATDRQQGKGELWGGANLDMALKWQNDLREIYVTDERINSWMKLQGGDFKLAKQFLQDSLSKQTHSDELKKKYNNLLASLRVASLMIAVIISLVVLSIPFIFIAWQAHKSAWQTYQAEQSEARRTQDLFNSQRTHSALLVRNEDFSSAKKLLEKTRELDSKLSHISAPRHARNLLQSFATLMDGESLRNYKAANGLQSIAVSPTGDKFVVVGENGFAAIFDTTRKESMQRLESHTGTVRAAVFHPQKAWIATAGDDKKIILWTLDGKKIKGWVTSSEIYTLAVNSEGMLLASGGKDKLIRLWNTETEKEIDTLSGHTDIITALTFDQNGKQLASASADKTARIWEMGTSTNKPITLKGYDDKVMDVAFSPDGKSLATTCKDGSVRIRNLTAKRIDDLVIGGEKITALSEPARIFNEGHRNTAFGVSFTSDGRFLVSSSADRTLRIWDVASGVTVRVLQGHESMVTDVAVQGDQIFSISSDGAIKCWDATSPYQRAIEIDSPEETEKQLSAIALSPNGKMVAVGSTAGSLRLYDLKNRQLLDQKLKIYQRDVQRIDFSSDNQWLATASLDGKVTLWKIKDNKLDEPFDFTHQKGVSAVAFSPDSKNLVSVSYDGSLAILRLDTRTVERYELAHNGGELNSVAFDESGQNMLTASDHLVRLWNFNDFKNNQLPQKSLLETKLDDIDVLWATLSPDAKSYAVTGRDAVVKVYTTENNQLLYNLVGHDTSVLRAAFSPDNGQLATVSGDATVRFWDVAQSDISIDTRALFSLRLPTNAGKPEPLWDFDFRCADNGKGQCWLAVPLTRGKLMLYDFGTIYTP